MANKEQKNEGKKGFSFRERLDHYSGVASGKVSTKSDSKFSDSEQRAYARGQRDAMNRQRCIFAFFKKKEKQQMKPVKVIEEKSDVGEKTFGRFQKNFEWGYNYAFPYGERSYQRSKEKIKYCEEALATIRPGDNNRDYLLSSIANERGKMKRYEEKNKK